ncbi:MAG TPA: hypothetical protein VN612_12760 [Acidobacteriaceae bacterium]|nr:hypothetical protein [Acidobacteriaceae bacterium]
MPTTPEPNATPDRDEIVARINLMETMIAEGRQATCQFGWIFVLWGLVDLSGMALQWERPNHWWNWPLAIGLGLVLQYAGFGLRRRSRGVCRPNTQSRAISAIWGMMGATLILFCFTAIFTHQSWGAGYLAAIFMTIGLAHTASGIILRWGVQFAVGAIFWAGGLACFFVNNERWFLYIFGLEMLFGMILFGIYAMILERRTPPPMMLAQ